MATSTPTRERVMAIETVIASGKANRSERYECDGGGGGDGGDAAGGGDTRMPKNSKSARRSRWVPAANRWRDATGGNGREVPSSDGSDLANAPVAKACLKPEK
ncbi:hypothetical protein CYMTET_37345 [Cymbomonas tetramitiformis]|uniref:Uncharacterized protein n=1 Tax=Cymbomonas tetramitiformis TaxID=36881 RepID=A0AAE0CE45_9CHLO|nr:hypothetical protein CYMTET_46602 [Cymbomonas tetramitiformis]KAK3253346.1 hypothetical protein CYMTET_37345 [Cymbomonas tetramitiformis]